MKRKNRFQIEHTPKRAELMKLMVSDDMNVARASNIAFASFLAPVVERFLDQASTVSQFYLDVPIAKGQSPTIPVDVYANHAEGDFKIWSQFKDGGHVTQTTSGQTEYPFIFYRLDSALSLERDYVEEARLDLMAKAVAKIISEFVAKQERLGWAPILAALAAGTNTNGLAHQITATTAGRFQLDDLNRLITRQMRLYTSFAGGTPTLDGGLTDLYVSPERMQDIRGFVYNPLNTTATPNTDESTALGLPDQMRMDIYNAAGAAALFGIDVHVYREFGLNGKMNTIYDGYEATNANVFNAATQDLVVGMDLSKETMLRPVKIDANGGKLVVKPDLQFSLNRDPKWGQFWKIEESRLILDNRNLCSVYV